MLSNDLIDDFVNLTQMLMNVESIPVNLATKQIKQNIFRLGELVKDAQNQSNERACNCKRSTQINN